MPKPGRSSSVRGKDGWVASWNHAVVAWRGRSRWTVASAARLRYADGARRSPPPARTSSWCCQVTPTERPSPRRPVAAAARPTTLASAELVVSAAWPRRCQSSPSNSGSGVTTLIAPPIASEPNRVDPGPRTTSTRSIDHGSISDVIWLGAGRNIASLTRMPSTSKSTLEPISPRTIGAPWPGPVRCTATPGRPSSRSPSTAVAAPGSARRAVTARVVRAASTRSSPTHGSSRTTTSSTSSAALAGSSARAGATMTTISAVTSDAAGARGMGATVPRRRAPSPWSIGRRGVHSAGLSAATGTGTGAARWARMRSIRCGRRSWPQVA